MGNCFACNFYEIAGWLQGSKLHLDAIAPAITMSICPKSYGGIDDEMTVQAQRAGRPLKEGGGGGGPEEEGSAQRALTTTAQRQR